MNNQAKIGSDSLSNGNNLPANGTLKVDFNFNNQVMVPQSILEPIIKRDTIKPYVPVRRIPRDPVVSFTHADSIKLNLINQFPDSVSYFFDNSVTRIINSNYTNISNNKNIKSKSVITELGSENPVDINTIAPPVNTLTQTSKSHLIVEKTIPKSSFSLYFPWLIPALLIIIIYTGLIRLFSGKYISQIFTAIFFTHSATSLQKSVNVRNSAPSFSLNLLFLLTFGIFLFEILTHYKIRPFGIHGILLFGLTIITSMMLSGIKYSAYYFVGYVFNIIDQTSDFLFQVNLLNKSFGLIILPIIAIVPFLSETGSSIVLQLGILLFILAYFMQILKGIKIILREPFSVVYMFLYLCALEILPLSILYKLIMS